MTLVQLRHLIALADSGSFSRAAAAAHVTQPALSRSIRALEGELGVPLVDRVGRRIELTPMGRETLPRARQLVFDARELQERTHAVAQGRFGTLRVGMGSGPGAMLMTPLLLEVATERPQWRVEVARGATELLLQRLRARTLDALVVDLRSLEPASDLDVTQVSEMQGAFMARRGHPLARRRTVGFGDLKLYPLASIPLSREVSRMLVERYGPHADPEQAVNVRCEDIASLVEVAERSDAVLLAIRASAPGLVELPMRPPLGVAARLGLVTLARRTEPQVLSVVRALMSRLLVDRPVSRTRPPAESAKRASFARARASSRAPSVRGR
ncbi:MAG: LysR family transcriptional regulator [Rubrivivax sp.]|nr:LysR family transcriptional regulator [Rubrivivax sp.]